MDRTFVIERRVRTFDPDREFDVNYVYMINVNDVIRKPREEHWKEMGTNMMIAQRFTENECKFLVDWLYPKAPNGLPHFNLVTYHAIEITHILWEQRGSLSGEKFGF